MMGATGAVGSQVMSTLQELSSLGKLTLLTRRALPEPLGHVTSQHVVDVLSPNTYEHLIAGHHAAVCTLGVGQPSKINQAEFIKIDKDAVISFAAACKRARVKHFELLCSVGADAHSRSFYLRTKGELKQALIDMQFERLSIFEPSMILTPTNRYGMGQALMLAVWPKLNLIMQGSWHKYRGIKVENLGFAMASNLFANKKGLEVLHWSEIMAAAKA